MKLNLAKEFDRDKAEAYFKKLFEKKAKIELKEFRPKRTIDQNSYIHVCFTIIANATGSTIQECKVDVKREHIKLVHNSFMVYEKNGKKYLRSTADLDTIEMTNFVDWLREWAYETLGCHIPTPEQYRLEQFEIQKQLEHVK
jgi:hypothetical protein